jgi:hypothetical protein
MIHNKFNFILGIVFLTISMFLAGTATGAHAATWSNIADWTVIALFISTVLIWTGIKG